MKVGDLVMFNDITNRYASWFYGQFGIVATYTAIGRIDGKASCRVRWLTPVKYYQNYTRYSDFSASNFEVYSEDR